MKMKKTEQEDKPNGRTKLHNVRFYNLTPRAIQVLAHNKSSKKLALSRNDGSIEIWDIQYCACLEKVIPQSPGNSVEGLVWAGDRLFSAGLNAELVEWDLQTLRPRHRQFVTGNAIWCLDVNPQGTELAIGTEEGYINIFDITDNQMLYKQLFDKQEGRVLCCKYDASGEHLVTGSMGVIRIWNVASGHAINRINVPRGESKKEVIVWSLQVLSDFKIISGDSRGYVTVWNGHNVSMVETHQVLKADVLTISINEEEELLVCSGIEPIIRIYAKTLIRKEDASYHRWVKFLQRNVHDHDVKTVLCVGDQIFSGGQDGYLGVTSMSKTKSSIARHGPFLQNPCIAVSPAQRVILLRYTNYLELWSIGSTSGKPGLAIGADADREQKGAAQEHKWLALERGPTKLLELKSRNGDPIISATISPNGQWIIYSTVSEVRVFRFIAAVEGQSATQLARIKDLPVQLSNNIASHLVFTNDSSRLFAVNPLTNEINIFNVLLNDGNDFDFADCIETQKHIKDTINHFVVSPTGQYIVAGSVDRNITVWTQRNNKAGKPNYKHLLNLPRYTAAISAIALHSEQTRIVAAFTDGKIFEYDFEEMCFTCSECEHFVQSCELYCCTAIILDERNPNVFIMQNCSDFFVLEKCKDADTFESEIANGTTTNRKSLKKAKQIVNDSRVGTLQVKSLQSFEHLIQLTWLTRDELIAVGVNPITLLAQLPDAFKQVKFGTS